MRSNFDSYSRTRLFFYSFDFFFFSPIFTSRGARGDLIFHRRRETRGTRRIMYTENQQNSSNRIDITFNHHALYRESIKRVELVCGNVLTTLWNKPARQKLLQFCNPWFPCLKNKAGSVEQRESKARGEIMNRPIYTLLWKIILRINCLKFRHNETRRNKREIRTRMNTVARLKIIFDILVTERRNFERNLKIF